MTTTVAMTKAVVMTAVVHSLLPCLNESTATLHHLRPPTSLPLLPLPLPQDASKETDKPSPWTEVAKYKLAAEDELRKHKDLDHVILRPAIVYGVGEWTMLGRKPTYIWA